jgi:integrase
MLRDITAAGIEDYQRERVKAVSPATSNREMALLKHMFNMAERWGEHQGANPVRFLRFLPEDNLRFETLSDEQENALCVASPPYLRELIVFAINTGLRTSDIFNLQWTEVDIEQKRLKKIVKKSSKPLSLPLNDAAFRVVEAKHGDQHGPYVFCNPMTGRQIQGREGSARRGCKAREAEESDLAYVPAHVRLPAHKGRGRYRDREGTAGALQHQHHHAIRPLER